MNEIAARDMRSATLTPSPWTDRSALSEAWYRALYGSSSNAMHAPDPKTHEAATSRPGSQQSTSQTEGTRASADVHVRSVTPNVERQRRPFATVTVYRARAEQKAPPAVARPAWRRAIARRLALRVVLQGGGRLDLLVQQRGRRVHVLALVEGARATRAAAALNRARVTLAAHGIRLEIEHA
ncbi:MAG: hypothetical protein IAI50_01710 [Candidatus Eremiobacteraeota bacterium]|nr:hypothetical protein [Candidatus Eremiobacteraeota bacterium]